MFDFCIVISVLIGVASIFLYLVLYAAPTHPPIDVQVLEVGTHNVSLMWAPPPEEFQNGVIRTYTINASEVETERSFIVHTSDLVYTLLHLHPYYTYNFTVAAVTVSSGPYSSATTVVTLETGT